jgi:uncharacterized protein YjbI with pentapeptide repeats
VVEIRSNKTGRVIHEVNAASLAGVNYSGAYQFRADLPGADHVGAILTGADLRYATLRGADMRRTDLGATFAHADLRGANLQHAEITGDFRDADLRGADMRYAIWRRDARFEGARFEGADLRGATLAGWTLRQTAAFVVSGILLCWIAVAITNHFRDHAPISPWQVERTLLTIWVITLPSSIRSPDLRRVNLEGVVWDDTTRWPWRFTPPTPPGDNGSRCGV